MSCIDKNKGGGVYIRHSKGKRAKNTSRSKRSKSKLNERSRSRSRSRSLPEDYVVNPSCSLFHDPKVSNTCEYKHTSGKSSKGARSPHIFRRHLKSLKKQLNNEKKFCCSDKSLYLSPEYVKLKLGKYEIC